MNKIIYVDMDGVVSNWADAAFKACNVELTPEIITRFKNGAQLEEIISESDMWSKINKLGIDFWANLELLPWAKELISELSSFAEVAFLSSPGNAKTHLETAANASYAKQGWVVKHFPDVPLILTREKHLVAKPQSILVDDTRLKIDEFAKAGGVTFHWPSQYILFDDPELVKTSIKRIKYLHDFLFTQQHVYDYKHY